MQGDSDMAWSIFEATGAIEAYLIYRDLAGEFGPEAGREESSYAMQNRRPGDPGQQRR